MVSIRTGLGCRVRWRYDFGYRLPARANKLETRTLKTALFGFKMFCSLSAHCTSSSPVHVQKQNSQVQVQVCVDFIKSMQNSFKKESKSAAKYSWTWAFDDPKILRRFGNRLACLDASKSSANAKPIAFAVPDSFHEKRQTRTPCVVRFAVTMSE